VSQSKDAISETVSENAPKRKRGRPAVYDASDMATLECLFPDVTTVRGRQNRARMTRALRVLNYGPAFYWLVSNEDEISKREGCFRTTILAELGRIENDDDLRAAAQQICKMKPRSKEAVSIIRRWRTGKNLKGGTISLTNAIIKTVNDYCDARPDTTLQMVLAALVKTADAFKEADEQN
jgi:hypothetical protein